MKKKLLRILIIEDNIDHIELLTTVVERNFAPVDLHTVETVDDALDFIEQTEYDLIMTDLYINGDSVLEQIPSLRIKLGSVPIIVITGSGDENLAAEVIKNGANDYIVKTKDSLEKIPSLIKKYLKKPGTKKEISHNKKKSPQPLKEQLLNEFATINKKAEQISSSSNSRIPDTKQLESLLDQIQHLKELASKLMDK